MIKRRDDMAKPSPNPRPIAYSSRPFSLLEILAVTGVAVVLMLMALPAFEKLASGGGMNVAARSLSTTLKLARQMAIAEKEYIGVAFPIAGWPFQTTYSGQANIPVEYFHQAYRVFRACPENGGMRSDTISQPGSWSGTQAGPYFMGWVPGCKWEFLPKGTIIAGLDTDTAVDIDNSVSNTGMSSTATADNKYNNLDSTCILWSPAKMPTNATAEANALIGDITGLPTGNNANVHFAAIVFRPDGKLLQDAVDNRIVSLRPGRFLGEPPGGVSTPGGLLLVEKDSANNFLPGVNISIDQFTGKVSVSDSN